MRIPLKRYWNLLKSYLRPEKPRVVLLSLAVSVGIALQLLTPQLLRRFVDSAVTKEALAVLLQIAVVYILAAVSAQFFSSWSKYLGEDVGWKATNHVRGDLTRHCLALDLSFHKTRTPGEMIERIDGDCSALANFFSQFIVGVLANAALLVGVLALLFRVDWRVGMALTAFAVISLGILWRIRDTAVPHWAAVRQVRAEFYGFLGERLSGTEDVRANGAGHYVLRRFHELLRRWYPLSRRASIAGYSLWLASIILFALGTVLSLSLGAYLYRHGSITIGTVCLIFAYTESIGRPLEQIRTQLQDLQQASASIGRVEELLAVRPRVRDVSGGATEKQPDGRVLPAGALAVAFRDVSFSYESGEETVLRSVSFRVRPGRILGLLGPTGSGKTTIARLLFRLYDPTSGSIDLGGVEAQAVGLAELRRRVGLVTQDVQIFHASVRDNLTLFRRTIAGQPATDERLTAVLGHLDLGDWLASLPSGLDTELGSGGGGLSAGEGQLLALARLFLVDPGLIVLDEASSRLDPLTEARLERAIDRALAGRTGIVIAHRLATVNRADDILILEGGRVIEYGVREALAGNPGSHFRRLLETGLEEVLA